MNAERTTQESVPLRVVLADDELLARQKLKVLLQREENVHLLAECASTAETVDAISRFKPDLLLLDIEMPGGSGFDALRRSAREHRPLIVFTTAYDQYAIQAFDEGAVDYLLKPFGQERFHKAIERSRAELLKSRWRTAETPRPGEKPRGPQPSSTSFVIQTRGRIDLVPMDSIEWVEASANYIVLHMGTAQHKVREHIGKIVHRLDPAKFARIHRGVIVNLSKIKSIIACNSGESIVVLVNGKELPCSRTYAKNLSERFRRDIAPEGRAGK